jgi:thiol-disulfide isomerase/thioredoxin
MAPSNFKLNCLTVLLTVILFVHTHIAEAIAPDIELQRVNGEMQSMADFIGKGKWVVINVWSPTCTACVRELPNIEAFRKKHKDNVIVLGLTIDYPSFAYGRIEIIRDFLEQKPIHYPLFLADLDMASDVIGNRLVGIPLIAIFHPDGNVLARWPGNIDTSEIEEFMANHQDYLPEDDLSFDVK